MELAVLADIHSNYIALERCMEYALNRGIFHFLFLGDYIGELAYPERTMELLGQYSEKYDCVFIRGNKENYWLKYRDGGEQGWPEYNSTTGALYYAYHHLKKRDLEFFESLRIAQKLQYGDLPTLIACHGSPTDVRGEIKPGNEAAKQVLEASEVNYVLSAHTHIQGKMVHRGKTAINPGSVGVSLKAGAKAQFAILHGENGSWQEEFISLDYDRERAVKELYESGLFKRAPYWCTITERLFYQKQEKEIGHAEVLFRVMELCRQDTGKCNWPDIPEKYWEQAVEELIPQAQRHSWHDGR